MKPFTQAILFLGVITLVFYALNPLEPFDGTTCVPDPTNPANQICGTSTPAASSPPPPASIDFTSLLGQYKQMTPEQQQLLQARVKQQRLQLGIVDSGFFSGGLHPELNQNVTAPPMAPRSQPSDSGSTDDQAAQAAVAAVAAQAAVAGQSQQSQQSPATLSDIQGLINTQVQSQLANQPIANCGVSKVYTDSPNYNEILRMADQQKQENERKQEQRDSQCAARKKKINRHQQHYRPTVPAVAICPQPDPSVWIKRNEIPCWNCKV
jgi:hypothetical protein